MSRLSQTRWLVTLPIAILAISLGAQQVQGVIPPSPAEIAEAARATAKIPLAAGGYCVVSLRDKSTWVEGDPQATAIFDGQRYLFAGPRELAIFAASPERYAPMLGGDCPMHYAADDCRVRGLIEFGLIYRKRVIFFATSTARDEFRADPARYIDADLAFDGRCAVSRVDQRRDVRGLEGTTTTYGGVRYRFAHDLARRTFLANPERYAMPAAPTTPRTQPSPARAADQRGSAQAADADDVAKPPALGGYCPVTLQTRGVWIRGRKQFRFNVDRHVYYAAGPEELTLLKADPEKYLPALGGDCVVTYVDQGERKPGSVYHAALVNERLYLFATAEQLAKFAADKRSYQTFEMARAAGRASDSILP